MKVGDQVYISPDDLVGVPPEVAQAMEEAAKIIGIKESFGIKLAFIQYANGSTAELPIELLHRIH
jgi:hypothetical protein